MYFLHQRITVPYITVITSHQRGKLNHCLKKKLQLR